MEQPVDQIASVLARAQKVLLVTHIHPDGDALGSQLALGYILRAMGKQVFLYGEEQVSRQYQFFPGSEEIGAPLPEPALFDCAVALDCGDGMRMGAAMEKLLAVHPFLVIDHHSGHHGFGDINWVSPERASTGEMVYDLACALGVDPGYEAAYCLYAAIVSDTGSFKYSSTTADTFRIAGELLGKGVKPAEVSGRLFDNYTVSRINLLRLVLDTLKLHAGGRLAVISAPWKFFSLTGTTQADSENFISYPRALEEVKIAVFIKESEEGRISVSLRSKGVDYDVARVAASFGGGGHRNAAGFKVADSSINELTERLLAALLPLFEKG